METRKIAIACSVAAVIFYALAALFAPQHVWLGTLGGLAAGYLSYEFREVLRAIPVAFRATEDVVGGAFFAICRSIWSGVDTWTSRSHPFTYGTLIMTATMMHYLFPLLFSDAEWSLYQAFLVGMVFSCMMALGVGCVLLFLSAMGKGEDDKTFVPNVVSFRVKVAYGDALRWVALGLLISFGTAVWKIVEILFDFLKSALFFPWKLFTLIHSHERLLCAVYGTAGGVISFTLFYAPELTFLEHALAAIFGGFIGAVFGILSWKFVSVRWLKVASMPKA